jgi:hypothetical protein
MISTSVNEAVRTQAVSPGNRQLVLDTAYRQCVLNTGSVY